MTEISRRHFVQAATIAAVASTLPACTLDQGRTPMYGLIGKMLVAPDRRATVIDILLAGTASMPGCLSYIVAEDPVDANAIWVTEVWDSKDHHLASLKLASVQQAIAQARPHIVGFGERFETVPVGGQGLARNG
jgi:quinol monooxygenase YgiN